MATNRMLLTLVLALVIDLPQSQAGGKRPKKDTRPSLNDISLEVAALLTIRQLELTMAQLEQLKTLAKETAEKPRRREAAKTSKEFRQKLEALHKVLTGGDGDSDALQEEVDELREKENPTLDDDIEITEAARRRAPEFLKQLKTTQLANFLAHNADEIADPVDLLIKGMGESRAWKDAELIEKREDLADQVALLAAGLDKGKAKKIQAQVVALVNRARGLDEKGYKLQLTKLEKTAEQIVGLIGPLEVLRNFTEHALAELLSNIRLDAALRARLKKE